MKPYRKPERAIAVGSSLIAGLAILLFAFQATAAVTVFEGARVIDGTGSPPIENATLVVDGETISAIGVADKIARPVGARVIDVHGRSIMPGIINAHGHLGLVVGKENRADGYTRENVTKHLDQFEQYGVTTLMSLGLNRDLVYTLRDEQRKGQLSGATLFTAGRGIGVPMGLSADAGRRRSALSTAHGR